MGSISIKARGGVKSINVPHPRCPAPLSPVTVDPVILLLAHKYSLVSSLCGAPDTALISSDVNLTIKCKSTA